MTACRKRADSWGDHRAGSGSAALSMDADLHRQFAGPRFISSHLLSVVCRLHACYLAVHCCSQMTVKEAIANDWATVKTYFKKQICCIYKRASEVHSARDVAALAAQPFPIVKTIAGYKKSYISHDAGAGGIWYKRDMGTSKGDADSESYNQTIHAATLRFAILEPLRRRLVDRDNDGVLMEIMTAHLRLKHNQAASDPQSLAATRAASGALPPLRLRECAAPPLAGRATTVVALRIVDDEAQVALDAARPAAAAAAAAAVAAVAGASAQLELCVLPLQCLSPLMRRCCRPSLCALRWACCACGACNSARLLRQLPPPAVRLPMEAMPPPRQRRQRCRRQQRQQRSILRQHWRCRWCRRWRSELRAPRARARRSHPAAARTRHQRVPERRWRCRCALCQGSKAGRCRRGGQHRSSKDAPPGSDSNMRCSRRGRAPRTRGIAARAAAAALLPLQHAAGRRRRMAASRCHRRSGRRGRRRRWCCCQSGRRSASRHAACAQREQRMLLGRRPPLRSSAAAAHLLSTARDRPHRPCCQQQQLQQHGSARQARRLRARLPSMVAWHAH
ncbi:hypothetical protein JKP88DRAFT_253441 [Tribonema minus]|uniref:Uncharacterized protein n=1 Tax=Tribonema minus TaxID=303371 RepID=A0A835ZA19_9STRA|nr:hypothetical protein JKP88DRAFT_253441 [Tribonema minus]